METKRFAIVGTDARQAAAGRSRLTDLGACGSH